MLTDCVIPLGTGSRLNNEELRYALRSLEVNASNLGRVFIIGEKPEFLNWGERLINIPYIERNNCYRNVAEKLRVVAEMADLSSVILFSNDDIYLVKKCDAGKIPHYSRGGQLATLKNRGQPLGKLKIADIAGSYHRMLKHTLEALEKRKLPTFVYSTHQCVNFEKSKILEVYREFEKELQAPYGTSFRCLYGNWFRIPRVVKPTFIVKDRWQIPAGRLAFASHKDVDPTMFKKRISAMFPDKSEFER